MTTDDAGHTPATLDLDAAQVLAGDLIRQLAPLIGTDGQEASMDDVFVRWLDALDVHRFSLVAIAALRTTYVACLSHADPGVNHLTPETPARWREPADRAETTHVA